MAVKLGEMQAQVMRLDSLGERIAKLTGVTPPKSENVSKGGQGIGADQSFATFVPR